MSGTEHYQTRIADVSTLQERLEYAEWELRHIARTCLERDRNVFAECADAVHEAAVALCQGGIENRVMALEELLKRKSNPVRTGGVWIETCTGGLAPGFVDTVAGGSVRFLSMFWNDETGNFAWFDADQYGKTWRCWPDKPADNLREMTEWQT